MALLAAAVPSVPPPVSNLLEHSPFLPPEGMTAGGASGAVQENRPLELRSIFKENGEYQFSLYDAARKQSTWVRLNEPGHDFMVKAFDSSKDTVTIEQNSRTYQLTLKEATIMTGGAGPQPSPVPVASSSFPLRLPQPGSGGNHPNGPPSMSQEQLRKLVAEINRRRELRREAAAAAAERARTQPTPTPQGSPH